MMLINRKLAGMSSACATLSNVVSAAMLSELSPSGGAPRVLVRFPDLLRPSARQGFARSATRFYFPVEDRQSNVWIAELSR
ncbi:MAG: hypothetical protein JJD97_02775 [Gemmatimonadaceae bacterium]|nr:hypothetical protein [Gemmatimonadaceae bacterium]